MGFLESFLFRGVLKKLFSFENLGVFCNEGFAFLMVFDGCLIVSSVCFMALIVGVKWFLVVFIVMFCGFDGDV